MMLAHLDGQHEHEVLAPELSFASAPERPPDAEQWGMSTLLRPVCCAKRLRPCILPGAREAPTPDVPEARQWSQGWRPCSLAGGQHTP
jgi:hypothetical protein